MKFALPSFSLLLALYFSALSVSARTDDYFIVIARESIGAHESDSQKVNQFFPSEVVRLLKRDGGKVLVQRIGEQPSFEIKSETENSFAKAPTWIAATNAIGQEEFFKLTSWHFEKQFISCAGGCDVGTTYTFSTDGSFSAVFESTTSPKPKKWLGHLYKSGNILWARPNGNSVRFNPDSVFYMRADGTLCTVVDCFGNR